MATISPANSTITDTVSLILLDTSKGSNITPGVTNNFITYISSSTVPGRIATVRDATGYVSTGNFILLSTTKNVFFADGSTTLSITQPFGFVSFSSRSTNQWSVLNTFAFPDPLGTSYVSNLNVMNSVNTSNISVNNISSGSISINSIIGNSFNSSNISTIYLSTNSIRANSISTISLSTNGIRANFIDTNSISTINLSTNGIRANSITATNFSGSNVYTNSIYSLNNNLIGINDDINLNNKNIFDCYSFYLQDTFNGNYPTQFFITEVLANGKTQLGYLSSNSPMEEKRNVAQDWSYYEAETNLNMVNYSISNTNIVYTTTIQTSNISSINISSSNISTANLFTPFIQASTISTSRLFTSLIQASTISTTSLVTSLIQASTISTASLFTSLIQASTISTISLFTTLVSTSFLQASTISTLSLNTRSISSLFTQTSSILTGLLQLRGVTSNGFLTTNTNASQLLFNGAQVGSWVGTATTDLNMNSFNINNVTNLNGTAVASIGGSSWSQYSATQDVNLNGYSLFNIASLNAPTMFTTQTNTPTSNVATNYVIPQYNYFQESDTNLIAKFTSPTLLQLIKTPTTYLSYTKSVFRLYNVSFQFSGETSALENTSNINYYCSLYNVNTNDIVNGNTINDTYPLAYTESALNPTKFSFSYSDVFDTTPLTWSGGDAIYPYLYAKTTNSFEYKFKNIKMNLTMTPII